VNIVLGVPGVLAGLAATMDDRMTSNIASGMAIA
jgi:hypothetical protein